MPEFQIYIHKYKLKRRLMPNSKTTDIFQKGALIKWQDESGCFGVADLCPWPSLGDLSLEQELNDQGDLFKRSLELAQKDYFHRKNKIKLNTGTAIQNHLIISDYKNTVPPFEGYSVAKIKANQDIYSLSDFLNTQHRHFKIIRLDFNSCLSEEKLTEFFRLLLDEVKNKIECIEDPYPFNFEKWSISKIPLAADFEKAPNWSLKIIKPSRQLVTDCLYLTSSMDHPIGVAHGLIEAQIYSNKTHGFQTLSFYEETPFHHYFKNEKNKLSYESDGYGIGFESELKKIIWQPFIDYRCSSENQIFVNESLNEKDQKDLRTLAHHFEMNICQKGHFLISSSGSSQSEDESLKLYAIKKENFLNSARRVNQHFKLTKEMNWGCVLPLYHVAGLSILARAFLSQADVCFCEWKKFSHQWVTENNIQVLSMIPSQVYDIVREKMKSPDCLKIVFVGASQISDELYQQAINLGWPLIRTYGMTETSSMIAEQLEDGSFKPFEGVVIEETNEKSIQIKTDSLADYVLQIKGGQIFVESISTASGYEGQDIIELNHGNFFLKGRKSDQVKINGYGVSLSYIRETFLNILNQNNIFFNEYAIIAIPHERSGFKLTIVSNQLSLLEPWIKTFNNTVLSHEVIYQTALIDFPIPRTELGKILYYQLSEKMKGKQINEIL